MAATWFLAGLGAGYLISSRRSEPDVWTRYAESLEQEFELPADRRNTLGLLLDHYSQEYRQIEHQHLAESHDAMESKLSALFFEADARIRNTIIPHSQRAHFDELRRPRRIVNPVQNSVQNQER